MSGLGSEPKAAGAIKFQQQNKKSNLFNETNKFKRENWDIREDASHVILSFNDPMVTENKEMRRLLTKRLQEKMKRTSSATFIGIKNEQERLLIEFSWPSGTPLDSQEMQNFSKLLFDNKKTYLSDLCHELGKKSEPLAAPVPTAEDETPAAADGPGGGSSSAEAKKRARSTPEPVAESPAKRTTLGEPVDTPASAGGGGSAGPASASPELISAELNTAPAAAFVFFDSVEETDAYLASLLLRLSSQHPA